MFLKAQVQANRLATKDPAKITTIICKLNQMTALFQIRQPRVEAQAVVDLKAAKTICIAEAKNSVVIISTINLSLG